ncbi:nucleotide-binding protein [Deferrisoma palaeochoriense]
MQIAVASGKGGTGKTTVATHLAWAASGGAGAALLDCDVEQPNCHLFVRPRISRVEPVTVPVPRVDESRCSSCGTCARVCEFNAIGCFGGTVLVFDHMCHGCGACAALCPEQAIREEPRPIGTVQEGTALGCAFRMGTLNVGEALAPPVIHAVRNGAERADLVVIDAPPGTSCPAMEAVRGADFVILVTEPTPFGLNDLHLAVEMVRALGLPCGVVLNRADRGAPSVRDYCRAQGLALLMELPFDRRVAEAYSRGQLAGEQIPEYGQRFRDLLTAIVEGLR